MQYPKEQIEFLQAVFDMRIAQNAYFSQRTSNRLIDSKRKEQRVDALLKPFINAGAIKAKPVASVGTQELFS